MAEAQLQIEHYWAGALRRAVIDGDVETGSVMAGQSVGMVTKEQPTAARNMMIVRSVFLREVAYAEVFIGINAHLFPADYTIRVTFCPSAAEYPTSSPL